MDDVERLIVLLSAASRRDRRRAREALRALPGPQVVPSLLRALERAPDHGAYSRLANLLADAGGDAAMEALSMQARAQRRFPTPAIRALARLDHPMVVPLLLDLLETGRIRQRRAAAYALARRREVRAIEPLCRAARQGAAGIGPEARDALGRFGPADYLALSVLLHGEFTTADRVRILGGLTILPVRRFPFRWTAFDPERFLARVAVAGDVPMLRERARAAADLARAQGLLLRPSQADGDLLLRAAHGPGRSSAGRLLRSADAPDEEDDDTGVREGWFARLLRRFGLA